MEYILINQNLHYHLFQFKHTVLEVYLIGLLGNHGVFRLYTIHMRMGSKYIYIRGTSTV